MEASIEQSFDNSGLKQQESIHSIPGISFDITEQIIKGALKLQSYWRMKKTVKIFKIRQRKIKHRGFVVKELVKTEDDYVKSLKLVIENVISHAKNKQKGDLLTADECSRIFSNMEQIMAFNEQFCKKLKERLEVYTPFSMFADEVVKMLDFFKLYYEYCNNFTNSRKILDDFKSSKHKFWRWIEPLECTPYLQNLDLSSLLVKPVQRLPKYVLLFKDLLKNTEHNHPDYSNISKALDKFMAINTENNYKMDKYLRNLRLFELEKSFKTMVSFDIVQLNREFIMEEVFSII
jgi:hypothetical protein